MQPSNLSGFVGSLGSNCAAICAVPDPGLSPCASDIFNIQGQVSQKARKPSGVRPKSLLACPLSVGTAAAVASQRHDQYVKASINSAL